MKQWEYEVIKMANDRERLNLLGEVGWELIAIIFIPGDELPYNYFKREIVG